MDDLPETMSREEWCVFSYRACHQGNPTARLQLARVYKRCTHVKDNMRYALFWLVMANESYLKQGGGNVILRSELSEEISAAAGALSAREVEYVKHRAEWAARYSFGLSNQSAPSDEEVDKFCDEMSQ